MKRCLWDQSFLKIQAVRRNSIRKDVNRTSKKTSDGVEFMGCKVSKVTFSHLDIQVLRGMTKRKCLHTSIERY